MHAAEEFFEVNTWTLEDEISQPSLENEQKSEQAQAQMDRQCTAWAAEKHKLQQAFSQARQSQQDAEAAVRRAQHDQAARKLELE